MVDKRWRAFVEVQRIENSDSKRQCKRKKCYMWLCWIRNRILAWFL